MKKMIVVPILCFILSPFVFAECYEAYKTYSGLKAETAICGELKYDNIGRYIEYRCSNDGLLYLDTYLSDCNQLGCDGIKVDSPYKHYLDDDEDSHRALCYKMEERLPTQEVPGAWVWVASYMYYENLNTFRIPAEPPMPPSGPRFKPSRGFVLDGCTGTGLPSVIVYGEPDKKPALPLIILGYTDNTGWYEVQVVNSAINLYEFRKEGYHTIPLQWLEPSLDGEYVRNENVFMYPEEGCKEPYIWSWNMSNWNETKIEIPITTIFEKILNWIKDFFIKLFSMSNTGSLNRATVYGTSTGGAGNEK